MKKRLYNIISHPLISGSAIVVIGSLGANVFNFFFNLFMSRNLTVSNYGTLASLISLLTLCILAVESFIPTIVHFSGIYFAKKEYAVVKGLFIIFTKVTVTLGLLVVILFSLFSHWIGAFFNISQPALVTLVGIIVGISFIAVVNRGMLQAKLSFVYISILNVIGTFSKFVLGVVFVLSGMQVTGALLAIICSSVLPYILSFLPIRNIFEEKTIEKNIGFKNILGYGTPAAISILALTFFATTDIIMVKHFFSPKEAGIYAGLALVGKVIFFLSAPIGMVMFPLVVQKHAKEEKFQTVFKLSLLLVFLPSAALTLFYFIFPVFSITFFLKNKDYLQVANLLGLFSIFITLYSLLSLLTNFYLSIKKTKVFIPIIVGAILQALGIWLFHGNFSQIISISIIAVCIPVIFLLGYYIRTYEINQET